jgi:hypothetical protein
MPEQGPQRPVTMRPRPPAWGPDVGPSGLGSRESRESRDVRRRCPVCVSPHPGGRGVDGSGPSRPPTRGRP